MMSMIPPTPSPVKQAKSSDVFLPEQLSLPQIYKISKENIDDIILPISNASCFLARKNVHTFNYSNRTFYL